MIFTTTKKSGKIQLNAETEMICLQQGLQHMRLAFCTKKPE